MSDEESCRCFLCDSPAVAVFRFSRGCYCNREETQALCVHHVHKSGPAAGGTMELIGDLTADDEFTRYWLDKQGGVAQ